MNLELGLEAPQRADEERAFTVRELVEGARDWVNRLPEVWVTGEVAGFKVWQGGQWYFSLRDRHSAVSCVMWSDDARQNQQPEEGQQVYARGALTVFAKKGQLQFRVRRVLGTAQGGLHALKLERALAALRADGVLDRPRRPIPPYPGRIAVVTSPEGAVWHDIVSVVRRRWPRCELVLVGTRVQGDEAPRELVRALGRAARLEGLDVLIVARGGGSREDLWAFNDEAVARALACLPVPTVSAVGHELDVALTDLVADHRAPTPSAAAEAVTPDQAELDAMLEQLGERLAHGAGSRVQAAGLLLDGLGHRLAGRVERRLTRARHLVGTAARLMHEGCERRLVAGRARVDRLGAALEALSPLKVLERGFAVAQDDEGRVLRRTADFPAGRAYLLRLADGAVRSRVEESP